MEMSRNFNDTNSVMSLGSSQDGDVQLTEFQAKKLAQDNIKYTREQDKIRFTEMLKQRKKDSLKLTNSTSPSRLTQSRPSNYESPYSQKALTKSSKNIKPFKKTNIPKQEALISDLLQHNNRSEVENYDFQSDLR